MKDEKDNFCIECTTCKKIIFKSVPVNGYIYILSNPCMPNLIKIGYTERSVFERLNELNSATGVPEPFIIEATFICENPKLDEQLIHSELSQKRNNKNREFFSIDAVDAFIVIKKILKRPPVFIGEKGRLHQKNIEDSRKNDEKKKQEAADEKRRLDLFERGIYQIPNSATQYSFVCLNCTKRFYSRYPSEFYTVCPFCFSSKFR